MIRTYLGTYLGNIQAFTIHSSNYDRFVVSGVTLGFSGASTDDSILNSYTI